MFNTVNFLFAKLSKIHLFIFIIVSGRSGGKGYMHGDNDYLYYRKILRGQRLPLAFIDLNNYDSNVAYVAETQRHTGKTIRIGSKSVRCISLLKRIFELGGNSYKGILAFTVEEAAFLTVNGFDDIIIAYPSVQPTDMNLMADMTASGKTISLMADSVEQLKAMSETGVNAGVTLKACIDVDMSYRPAGSGLHLGVRRSPLRNIDDVMALVEYSKNLPGMKIDSLMGYEAHIASLEDDLPGQGFQNRVKRLIKKLSVRELTKRRDSVVSALKKAGVNLRTVNGGGSGSLVSSGKDPDLTEVTAGSAFFCPAIFHHFKEVRFKPAAFFALQVVRKPAPGIITCHGGGYAASGSAGMDKLPVPVFPEGLKLLPMEGAGEVQTPLVLPGNCPPLEVGDQVFFQHAKAGELCERFNELYLIKDGKIVDRIKTYRGEGCAFL
jgi:D-serine deaminase-like pyridoxal phosphate-dependent protein